MNYFLYLVIGVNSAILEELHCSLWSLKEVTAKKDFEVVLYTDATLAIEQESFDFKITVNILSRSQLLEWLSDTNYLLILKPRVIKHFLDHHQGNVLFLDTDTFLMRDPVDLFDAIGKGALVMHLKENIITKRKAFRENVLPHVFTLANGSQFRVGSSTAMWNSGVIGICNRHAGLLDEALLFTKQMWKIGRWHTIEQFALSYFFQREGKILAADRHVMHYWFFRQTRYLLGHYFNINGEAGEKFIREILEQGILDQHPSYETLPQYAMEIFKTRSTVFDWHLYTLPGDTYPGKLLRRVMVKDIRSLVFVLKAAYRMKFQKDIIREVYTNKFEYKL
jgi:hypothetical protein